MIDLACEVKIHSVFASVMERPACSELKPSILCFTPESDEAPAPLIEVYCIMDH